MPYAKLPEGFPKPTIPPKRYFEDMDWLLRHEYELAQQYPDQWVAVFNKEVVAAGEVLAEVHRVAEEKTGERDIAVWLVTTKRKFYAPYRVAL